MYPCLPYSAVILIGTALWTYFGNMMALSLDMLTNCMFFPALLSVFYAPGLWDYLLQVIGYNKVRNLCKVLALIFWHYLIPFLNERLFLGKQIVCTAKDFSADLFVPRSDSFPMNPEKNHPFLIFTMFPSKIFSKIRDKLKIQISFIYGHA